MQIIIILVFILEYNTFIVKCVESEHKNLPNHWASKLEAWCYNHSFSKISNIDCKKHQLRMKARIMGLKGLNDSEDEADISNQVTTNKPKKHIPDCFDPPYLPVFMYLRIFYMSCLSMYSYVTTIDICLTFM
ncbi:unnamed protein product, partial [Gordionus sp. m RMFG-2023]